MGTDKCSIEALLMSTDNMFSCINKKNIHSLGLKKHLTRS